MLRAQQVTQSALNARPIEVAARANPHYRPRCLGRSTLPNAFSRRIFVRGASFAPATVAVLTALQPIATAQYPILCHVLANRTQAAQNLPRAIRVIDAPPAVPRTVIFLRLDQKLESSSHRQMIPVEIDVAKKLERASGQIAASWIENRIVISERHVFEPRRRHVFVERGPAAIVALKTELPIKGAPKYFVE